ncbi:BLOC-1-related complex subunit 8-like isoform X2 [Panonychus citri]|uniref:BLOC-1-related complex subunit 8-like isoform X2 n=1 Tax=Panonychus citri TaxID=50023 RepID=UPI002307474F|nr:BLOC-1-related complex subunit 8-like isoform X2 [Panonychus citri]
MDTDLIKKTRKTCEKNSESLYMIANEPTLACFRIAEHVYKSGPHIQERGVEMKKLENQLKGACYDLDYTVKAIKSMEKSKNNFSKIKDLLKDAFFYKQQIDYDNNVRYRVANRGNDQHHKRQANQRFSGSFDIPSFISSHLPSSPSTSMMSSGSLVRSDSVPPTKSKPSSPKSENNQPNKPSEQSN